MANLELHTSTILKTTLCIFLLAIFLGSAAATRTLMDPNPLLTNQHLTSGPIEPVDVAPQDDPNPDPPTTIAPVDVAPQADPNPNPDPPTTIAPAPIITPSAPTVAPTVTTPTTTAPPVTNASPAVATTAGGGGGGVNGEHPTLSFFMHDVLGGTHSTSRVVTGIIATSDANVVPFSSPNSQVFPITGGVPLNNINGIVNNNNVPFLAGFNGNNPNNPNANTVLQNTGNNAVTTGGNNLPFVAAGQLPAGITLQQLMFGSITVIDHELTEGHELGTGVIGEGRASEVSHIAVIGGTGKYGEAKGYATIESLPQVDEHVTDGVETIVHVNVYLTTP
ncbi:hypothetical protein OSB04_026557 [Centaurea solstitialis]|uniref:Dirigent protein n=1 Tax=Centaurea solstitialis TaxID=347529 RepID=A0AA38W9E5_9ASTR|nr:hypothetical protein OSB04_026557 [Centaurea solstitialis]